MTIGQSFGKGSDLSIAKAYIPTVEACWDYGIARNAPLLPFVGSMLPYNFLRGVQFDTKIFKLWEFVAAGGQNLKGLVTGLAARNEILMIKNENPTIDAVQKHFNIVAPVINMSSDSSAVISNTQLTALSEDIKKKINFLIGDQLCIAVDGDSDFTAKITNKWGGGEDILTQAIQGVAEIAKNLTEAGRTISGIMDENGVAGVPFSPMRYQGTDFGTITINFTLFTRNHYIRDIHLPLTLLKSYCIPSKSGWSEDVIKSKLDVTAIQSYLRGLTGKELEAKRAQLTADTLKAIAGFAAGRFKILKTPPTFTVQHNARLFFMKKGVITDFTFKPEGPWVRMEYDGLFGKIFGGLSPSVGTALDRLLQDVYVKFPNYPEMCYPTRVKCSMTLKETDFITLEDYANEDLNRVTSAIASVVATAADSGQLAASIMAGGIAQNLDILAPDIKGAGDLLSGGKWVPPGESVSGIPGFL
jgi:hypothetical protein